MEKLRILVIEDEQLTQKTMAMHLAPHEVRFAADPRAAARALDAEAFDLCFIDLRLGEGGALSGLQLIPRAAKKGVYAVVMSSCDSEEAVSQAYALGCSDFYVKGNEAANIVEVLDRHRRRREGFDEDYVFSRQFVTRDPATRAGVLEAVKYAATELPIMILGPSGTGKTSLGRIIHEHSRREGPFVAINCAAYTEDLLEAELFGYRKGAFTGASDSRKGKLLQAHRGTLFLDEIGAMSLGMQTKLLKAIEERLFYPVGSDAPESSEFRLVSATLEDVQELIARGRLRFDFFQRVHGLTVSLKPLAQRRGDILPLIEFFTRDGKRLAFTADAKARLLVHPWPGNARELKKLVELLRAGAEGRVTLERLERHLKALAGAQAGGEPRLDESWYRRALAEGLPGTVDRFVDEIVRRNLSENRGKKSRTLLDLRISNRLLYASLKRSGGAPA